MGFVSKDAPAATSPYPVRSLEEEASVSARFLLGIFDSVYVIALTAWVGSILILLVWRGANHLHGARFRERGQVYTPPLFSTYLCMGGDSRGRSHCHLSWLCRSVIPNTAGDPSRFNRWLSCPPR